MESVPAVAGFVSLADVVSMLGVSGVALRQRLEREGITVYQHPHDGRFRLLKKRDVQRLLRPVPVARKGARHATA